MEGWIKLHRKIQDHWIYQEKRKFSRYEAWLDMLMMANHKSNKFLHGNELIELEKGQFVTSEVKLMERWDWGKNKLRLFFNLLEKDGMIVKKSDRKRTTITICNYGLYHTFETKDGLQTDYERTDNGLITDTNKNEENVNNDLEKKLSSSGIGEIDPIFGQAYEMMQQHFHYMNAIQQDEISRYLDNGLNLEVLQEAINKTKLGGKDMNYLFGILRKCEEQGVKTLDQYKEKEAQHQREKEFKQQRQQRSTYNKPTKPVIPVVQNEPQPQLSQEEIEQALEMARRLDSTRKTG